jgi:hypothetical protein
MRLAMAVDDETLTATLRRAKQLGTSLNRMIRSYLQALLGRSDWHRQADEFILLSRHARGDSRGWNSNRDELHER